MRFLNRLLVLVLVMSGLGLMAKPPANFNHHSVPPPGGSTAEVGYRSNCAPATQQTDMAINNVRARLLNGGDLWWDLKGNGRYIVPKVDVASGQQEVSSLFAGAVWIGGFDPSGNLKMAALTYRSASANDFWPGPLNPTDGTVEQQVCKNWDKFFRVTGENIRKHQKNWNFHKARNEPYPEDEIPKDVRGWPARGNQFFQIIHDFDLPNTTQGLGLFFDDNKNGDYEPQLGDYPVIDIRGCPDNIFPDEMVFWIYNDNGNIHTQTGAAAIQMEVQVQSFAFTTQDELNDMTFYRYKLINRANTSIDSCFFAMWLDPDLGCSDDDYIGCDTIFVKNDTCELADGSIKINPRRRDLMYVYNADQTDGITGCSCPVGGTNTPTYCNNVPILGCDYFRGPLDQDGCELGMSSFMYHARNATIGAMNDPGTKGEFYNILTGRWKDGTPLTPSGSGYNPGSTAATTKYAFSSPPQDPAPAWSMCSQTLPKLDLRTIQSSGPMRLDQGRVNELIVGMPWVPNIQYPCPDLEPLLYADRLAQGLFDNCFRIIDGPTAPDLDWVELNKEVICVLSNDEGSNNYKELYSEADFLAPTNVPAADKNYVFEGYKVYQLRSPNTTRSDLDDPEEARLVFQCDVKNNVQKIYNWVPTKNPFSTIPFYVPVEKTNTPPNAGVNHSFSITEDQFGSGDTRKLVNHKKYYYLALAYGHNSFAQFNPDDRSGQRTPYIEGRLNVKTYTVIPRPIVHTELNAGYGDGPEITRIEGAGVGHIAVELKEGEHERILSPNFNGELTYVEGKGPLNIRIYDPLNVKNGEFELKITDATPNDDILDASANWTLTDVKTGFTVASERSIERLNEQLIAEYGFSVSIAQTPDAGGLADISNGALSATWTFKDPSQPWLFGIPNTIESLGQGGAPIFPFQYILTQPGQLKYSKDPDQSLTKMDDGFFVPYGLTSIVPGVLPFEFAMSPRWWPSNASFTNNTDQGNGLENLNNVDIVFTSDKSKWSRCVVIETANNLYTEAGATTLDLNTESGDDWAAAPKPWRRRSFDPRYALSVGKDADANGRPIPDGAVEPDQLPNAQGVLVDNPNKGKPIRGMGWFPGYAIDVETGERLNIFWGENSIYDGIPEAGQNVIEPSNGRDMMFNPGSEVIFPNFSSYSPYVYPLGGQHFVYVTREKYDGCTAIRERLEPDKASGLTQKSTNKINPIKLITWAGMMMTDPAGLKMKSYADGLIPNDVTVKLRVDNPYQVKKVGASGYPHYRFKIEGKQSTALDELTTENSLDSIKMVPNPYYGYSQYEATQFNNIVKVTNLPAKCVVTIYSLDGKFIRQYDRDEVNVFDDRFAAPVPGRQFAPDLEWDMKNSKGIPVASGVYLVHVNAPGVGERTLKWFGIGREFDPSGL